MASDVIHFFLQIMKINLEQKKYNWFKIEELVTQVLASRLWLGQNQKCLSADEVMLFGLLPCPTLCLRTRKDMPEVYSLNQLASNSVLTRLSSNLSRHYGYISSNKESYKSAVGGRSRAKIYVHQKRAWYKPSLSSLRSLARSWGKQPCLYWDREKMRKWKVLKGRK